MKRLAAIFLILTFTTSYVSFGQDKDSRRKEKITVIIQELFDAYRAGDSTRVRAVFTADAHAQSVSTNADGNDKLSDLMSIDNFIKYIGGGLSEVHDEKLWDMQIFADNQLATVWTKYAFFLGENFTHCGTETFLLRKVKGNWKIFYLVDTRQKTGCKLPDEIKK